ncbi:methyltransferase domain-containing protein [Candidatus Woesearchaeota archaeon]|nr:methyltransferase domain-containing protein [Candidatus Woesearchaeota archaeon]
MKMLFTRKGESFFYKGDDIHTKYGCIKKEAIESTSPGDAVMTGTGKEMMVSAAGFPDHFRKLRRNAQIIIAKDMGAIVAETGLNSKSVVLDSGSGSGGSTCFLAHIVKKVYSYEIRPDFIETVKKNIAFLGLKNVVLKNRDIYDGISEKNLDAVILDLPEPWRAVPHAVAALKHGGYLVSYSPNITQAKRMVEAVLDTDELLYKRTIEIIEREWEIDRLRARPKFQMLGHTGFLSFSRKY